MWGAMPIFPQLLFVSSALQLHSSTRFSADGASCDFWTITLEGGEGTLVSLDMKSFSVRCLLTRVVLAPICVPVRFQR